MKKKIVKGKLKPAMKKGMHKMPNGEMMRNQKMKHAKMSKTQAMKHENKETMKEEGIEHEYETESEME
jgi:hypothetical protein